MDPQSTGWAILINPDEAPTIVDPGINSYVPPLRRGLLQVKSYSGPG